MADLIPYLKFDGNCREAMNFYKGVLGGELYIQTVGESPMPDNFGPNMKDKVMHASLNSGSMMLMGSDLAPDGGLINGNRIDLTLACKSKEEMDMHFTKLSEGGKVNMKLEEMYFGWFGAVTDKYGFSWTLQFGEMKK